MPKKVLILIVAVLLLCVLKFLGVEFRQGEATAASSSISGSEIKNSKKTKAPIAVNTPVPSLSILELKTTEKITNVDQPSLRNVTRYEAYCRLLAAGVNLKETDLKLSHIPYVRGPGGETYLKVLVQTPDCPVGTFSRYELDQDNRILESMDCQDVTREDIALINGLQSEIIDIGPRPGKFDVAISGDGMFVIKCDDEIRYSRSGNWDVTAEGTLSTKDAACKVLDRQGSVFQVRAESDLDEKGCNSRGECLAVVFPEPGTFEVLDRKTLVATTAEPSTQPPLDAKIFMNSLEDLQDPQTGILGPDFESLPYLDKPEWCPDSFN